MYTKVYLGLIFGGELHIYMKKYKAEGLNSFVNLIPLLQR
jgi:hypothetical protein